MARFAIIGPSTVFAFLSILLIASRIAPINGLYSYIVIICVAAAVFIILYKIDGTETAFISVFSIGIFFIICTAWTFTTNFLFDPSFDAYLYHLSAIWALSDGWHPFFSHHENIWVDSFPNGHWVLQSFLVSVTGDLLAGQSLTVGLMAAVGVLSYGFFFNQFSKHIPRYRLVAPPLFSLLVVANPVVLTQVLTHYIDAPLYLYGCGLTLLILSDSIAPNRVILWSAAACVVLILNTKASALYYTPIIIVGGMLSEMIIRNAEPRFKFCVFWIRSKGCVFGLALVFGIIFVGFKPYVTNILDHGHVLYPSIKVITQGQGPPNIESLPGPVKFIYGILARSESWQANGPLNLKLPGAINVSELRVLTSDTRRGGFGPFFSLGFFAAIAASVGCVLACRTKTKYRCPREGLAIASISILLLGASMFFPEPWWARYIPFTWLGAVLLAMSGLYVVGQGKALFFIRFLIGLAVISFMGSAVTGALGARRQIISMHQRMAVTIEKMKQFTLVELVVPDPSTNSANSVWAELLRKHGVNARAVKQLRECVSSGKLNSAVTWCGRLGKQN